MGLVAIGPVAIAHGDPGITNAVDPTDHGVEVLTVTGSCSWAASDTLREMVKNEAARITSHGHTGILDELTFDDALLSALTGQYIIKSFVRTAGQQDSLTTTDVPFTMVAVGPLP